MRTYYVPSILSLSVLAAAGCAGSSPDDATMSSSGAAAAPASVPGARGTPLATVHTRSAVRDGTARPVGRLDPSRSLRLHIVLSVRDGAALDAFVADVSDPASPNYRHYLTVQEFSEEFGPSQADYDALVQFAEDNGLAMTSGSRDAMGIQVEGSVSAIESAFHVNLMTYQHPVEARTFYAPDREPTTRLPFALWHVSGLDDYSIPHPKFVKGSSDVADAKHTGSGPSGSYLGSDMRAAYYGGTALTGAGQTLGLFEYSGTDLEDLSTYYKNAHETNNVPVTLTSTDGTSTSCDRSKGCDDTEQTLDMTQALGMAPGLDGLVMFVGSSDTSILGAITTASPLPKTVGCSWGWSPADPSTLDPYFKKMAAQGQTFAVASGDDSTWKSTNSAWPADDVNVLSVGGTDLTTTSAGGAWSAETAWADSGGGIATQIAIPSWQTLSGVIDSANEGSTKYRNGPDVAANANFSFYVCADQQGCTANEEGGTSFAAPMWAGFLALVNQDLASLGKPSVGFINPTIYADNVTHAYAKGFHDITEGKSGSYSAVTGYDLVTGWGSPKSGLVKKLAP